MNLCLGERLDGANWTGLPLGRFAPPGHGPALPVAAAQDTLFVWRDGASAARVRSHRAVQHYARHAGVVDLMVEDEEVFIAHDVPEAPGECLLVGIPIELRAEFSGRPSRELRLRSCFGETDTHLLELARALERQCTGGEPLGRFYTESLSATLVEYVTARYADRHAPDPRPALRRPGRLTTTQQRRVYSYIEERVGENPGLGELAAFAGYSPQHFVRLFRATFGESPHQFVLRRRIEHAKRMLADERVSLSEVAAACGFADQSHFTVTFARLVGRPPGRYRAEQCSSRAAATCARRRST